MKRKKTRVKLILYLQVVSLGQGSGADRVDHSSVGVVVEVSKSLPQPQDLRDLKVVITILKVIVQATTLTTLHQLRRS